MDTKGRGFEGRRLKEKSREKREMVFGIRPIMECLQAGRDFEKIFVQKNLKGDNFKSLWTVLKSSSTPISKVPLERLNKFTGKNHQGIIGFISPVKYFTMESVIQNLYEKGRSPFIVVLDGITDVRNFGAIARSAECLGADAIILPTTDTVQVNADAMKTSAGALNILPVCRTPKLSVALDYLKDSGLKIVGVSERAEQRIQDMDLRSPVAVILGSEETGISDKILPICDEMGKIELYGNIPSLNVSTAATVAFYEINRQRY